MNIQEREQWEYEAGWASEQQNALAVSRMNQPPDDSDKINEAIANGLYVVIEEGPAYCPITDAIMGSRQYLVTTFKTLEEASRYIGRLNREEYNPDINYRVAGPTPKMTKPPLTNDDVPF